MSLRQKGKGLSKRVKVALISVALALVVAVGGIVAAVSLTKNNKKVGGSFGSSVAVTTHSDGFGQYANGDKYNITSTTLTQSTVTVNSSAARGTETNPYVITNVTQWNLFASKINAGQLLTGVFTIQAPNNVLDFAGATVTPVGKNATNAFKGTLYGNKTKFSNAKFGNADNYVASGLTDAYFNGTSFKVFTGIASGLFGYTGGCWIRDIIIENTCSSVNDRKYGNLTTGEPVFGSVIAVATSDTYLINVSSNMSCSINVAAPATNCGSMLGGLIGVAHKFNTLSLLGCSYNGTVSIDGSVTGRNSHSVVAGYVGILDGNLNSTINLLGCTMDSTIKTANGADGSGGALFGRCYTYYKLNWQKCYFNCYISTPNGTPDFGLFGYALSLYTVSGATVANVASKLDTIYLIVHQEGLWTFNSNPVVVDTGVDMTGTTAVLNKEKNCSLRKVNVCATWTVGPYGQAHGGAGAMEKTTQDKKVIDDKVKSDTELGGTLGVNPSTGEVTGPKTTPFVVTYVTGGISGVDTTNLPQTYSSGATNAIGNPATVPAGLKFEGWYLNSLSGTKITSLSGRTGNIDLYAKYTIDTAASNFTFAKVDASGVYATTGTKTIQVNISSYKVSAYANITDIAWYNKDGTKITTGNGITVSTTANTGATNSIVFTAPTVALAEKSNYYIKFKVTPKSGYSCIAASGELTSSALNATTGSATLTITKAEVTNPTVTTEFTYDSSEKDMIVAAGDSTLYDVSGTTKATKANNYTAQFTLKDAANYKWKTTTGLPAGVTLPSESGVLTVNWKIKQAQFGGGGSTGGGNGSEHDDPDDPDNPSEGEGEDDGGDGFSSYVKFVLGNEGIVGLQLNNAEHSVSISGEAYFTYANGTKQEIKGTFGWKTPSEVISYEFFDFTAAESNDNKSVYKTIAVFTPEDNSIAPYEREVVLSVKGHVIYLLDIPVDPETGVNQNPGTAEKLWIDYNSRVMIQPEFGQSKVTVGYYWGAKLLTKEIAAQAPKGFSARVYYNRGGTPTDIAGLNNVFTLDFTTTAGASYYNQTFNIGYTPRNDTKFSVYYVLEKTSDLSDSDYVSTAGLHYPYAPEALAVDLDAAANSDNPVVYKANATGKTTGFVHYMESGRLLTTIKDITEVTKHYELDSEANAYLNNKRIAGDGSTVAVVYLKAKYHTVTFLAIGASEHGMQTQEVKYLATIDASKVKEPVKTGASFNGWFEAQSGGNPLTLGNIVITGDITFYAQFTSTYYYIVFDMNGFTGNAATPAPNDYAINLSVIPSENGLPSTATVDNRINWNHDTFFASYGNEDFFYAVNPDSESNGSRWKVGDYVFRYTVDTLTNNISLNVTAGKPSAVSYTFTDWYQGNTRVRSITAPANYTSGTPDSVIKLTARWTKQTYNLVFDKQDGSRTTQVSGVTNLSKWDDIFNKNATAQALKAPTRNGYTFEGWYATADCQGNEATTNLGTGGWFSVYDYKNIYKTESGSYNFSTIRLYALWESVEIKPEVEQDLIGGAVGNPYVTDEYKQDHEDHDGYTLEIGVEVEVDIEEDAGYQFGYLIVGARKRPIYKDANGRVKFTIASTDLVFVSADDDGNDYGIDYGRLDISAVFNGIVYTINYNTEGGESSDSKVVRTYTRKELDEGSVELPSKLKKLGYDFGGWIFENANEASGDEIYAEDGEPINGRYAFITDGKNLEESLWGETLVLTTYELSSNVNWYANFSLKAKWIKQAAELRLYGARYVVDDGYGSATDGYYSIDSINGNKLHTDDTIQIKSPTSNSFYFIGWALKPGGEVVYAAELLAQRGEDGKIEKDEEGNEIYISQPVTYKLKASRDVNDNETKANYLYAVWQIKSLSYVTVTAKNNNSIYDGTGVVLSARTAKEYEDDEIVGDNGIIITYSWYRVKDNATTGDTVVDYYSTLFKVSKRIYLNADGSELGTIYYGDDGKETSRDPELPEDLSGYTYIEEKTLNMDLLETNCDKRGQSVTRSGAELTTPVEMTVQNVRHAGRYICVATLNNSASVAFGEITVEMQKAYFSSVVFQNDIKAYDGNAKNISVKLANSKDAKSLVGNKLTLLDDTVVTITYGYKLASSYGNPTLGADDKYYDSMGNLVNEDGYVINENGSLSQSVYNAGKYEVTAYFEIRPEDDKGNYTVIDSISAELEVTPRTLTNVEFTVSHVSADGTEFKDDGKFSFTYDGNVYEISAKINDTDISGEKLADVLAGKVSLTVKVYEYDDKTGRGAELTSNGGNALNAGKYIAVIQKDLQGVSGKNYTLGEITTTQVFEIAKARRDYGLSFEDAKVTFDNKIHTIEVKSNTQLPDTLKIEYSVKVMLDEESLASYNDIKYLPNDEYIRGDDGYVESATSNKVNNGGRHAGTYEISVTFTDTESQNYEPVEMEPATLTIEKANLFEFYATDEDKTVEDGMKNLLGDFATNHKFSYVVGANRMTFINGNNSLLTENDSNSQPYFGIRYTVYRDIEGIYQPFAIGTQSELVANNIVINAAGKYMMEANIDFVSPLYKNDFKEVDTLSVEIEIEAGIIDRIEVEYTEDRKTVQYIGEEFDMASVSRIIVYYQGEGGSSLTLSGDGLAIVKVVYGEEHTAFWKVGEAIDLVFEVYGVTTRVTENDKIKIMQKITEGADLRYSTDGYTYQSIGEFGLDLEEIGAEESAYSYRIYFSGIDEEGELKKDMYLDVEVDATALRRGSNIIEAGEIGLYDLSELVITLDAYKTVESTNNWKYRIEGSDKWEDLDSDVLPYIANEYYIGVTFEGDSGNELIAYVSEEMLLNADSYHIRNAEVYTNDDSRYTYKDKFYRLENLDFGMLTIEKHELSFVWENVELKYTGEAQTIKLKESGVLDPDKDDIDFIYEYYKVTDGVATSVTTNAILEAGDYRITVAGIVVKPGVDFVKAENYKLPENNSRDFTIKKADIVFEEVWYEEASYGRGNTFKENPQGLRATSIQHSFGSNKEVAGNFYFVKPDGKGGYERLNDIEAGEQYLKTANARVTVYYAYSPLDVKNYNVLVKTFTLNVQTQMSKNELKVTKKAKAVDFYIVDGTVYTDRIDVYEVYTSYYEENGVGYGKLEPLSAYSAYANGQRIDSNTGYKVKDSDDSVIITVYHSINSDVKGSITFRVYKSQPTKLTLSDAAKAKIREYKENWYVGEQFELPVSGPYAIEFTLSFENGDTATLYFGDLNYTVSGVGFSSDNLFTEAGTATITFDYAGLTTTLQLEIKPKEDLEITTPTTKVEKYDGTVKAVPELFAGSVSLKDGIPGVSYVYEISRRTMGANGRYEYTPVDRILEEGTYVVTYMFTVTNPRYNTPTDFRIIIDVKTIAYQAVFKQFTEAQLTSVYSGNEITPPTAELSHIRDLITDRDIENAGTVELTSITLNGTETKIKGVGEYEVVWTAKYNGEEIGTYKYTYRVTRAENSATLTVKNILVGSAVSYEVTNLKFGGPFDAATMITFSDNEHSGFTSAMPTEVGVWYIKLEVQGTNDYSRLTIVKSFTISNKSLSSGGKNDDGDVWADVEAGDNGLAPGTKLEVSKVGQEELDELKVKNQTVLDGYDVALKTANGEDVALNGEIKVRLLISGELRGIEKLSVRLVTVDENGKVKTEEIKNVERSEDGKYLVFSASTLGRFVITEKIPTAPGGLIAGVSICAVIAAGLIVACVLVFLKKRG